MSLPLMVRRALALSLLALILIVAWMIIVQPVLDVWANRHASREQSLKLLAGYQRSAARRSALDDQLKALRAREGGAQGPVSGGSAALAAASLQGEIKRMIENNGGEIRSVQPLPSSNAGDFEKIELRYDLTLALGSLSEILYQIETHTPYLFLDNLDIRGMEGQSSDGQGQKDQKLTVRWTILAYRRVDSK